MSELNFGDALKVFLEKSRMKSSVQALQITDIWQNIMGTTVAKYTERIELINQTLYIYTNVAPLRQELSFQKEKIIERVNEALAKKAVKEVIIK